MFCARDHFGQRPFYYHWEDGRFSFSDSLGDLKTLIGHDGAIDEIGLVAQLVRHGPLQASRTSFAGVLKLPPASLLVVTPGRQPQPKTYWRPEPGTSPTRDPYDCAAQLRVALIDAVFSTIRSDEAIASHLSGGLDSSTVAVIADRHLKGSGRQLSSLYSWSPPGADLGDERGRIVPVAANIGAPLIFSEVGPRDMNADLRRDLDRVPNETCLYERQILADAQRRGVGLILSGWGGDECASFSAAGHLRPMMRRGHIGHVARHMVAAARNRGQTGLALSKSVMRALGAAAAPPRLVTALRNVRGSHGPFLTDWAALHPAAPDLRREAIAAVSPRATIAETQCALLSNGHLAVRMEAWDELAKAHNIEYAYPLLDRRLVELALSLPERVWLNDGFTRWVFREAVDPFLSRDISWGSPKSEPARMGTFLDLALRPPEPMAPTNDAQALLLRYRAMAVEALEAHLARNHL